MQCDMVENDIVEPDMEARYTVGCCMVRKTIVYDRIEPNLR